MSFQFGDSVACCINLRIDFGTIVESVRRQTIL